MQERHLYEYAVIRVVPCVEREEFMNVGVIMYCQKQKFLQTLFHLNKERLQIISDTLDIEEVEEYLHSFQQICKGGINTGPIGKLDLASRFRWLTATRSTMIQISKVHPGLCTDAGKTLETLFKQLVL